jgi:hypothetical protein
MLVMKNITPTYVFGNIASQKLGIPQARLKTLAEAGLISSLKTSPTSVRKYDCSVVAKQLAAMARQGRVSVKSGKEPVLAEVKPAEAKAAAAASASDPHWDRYGKNYGHPSMSAAEIAKVREEVQIECEEEAKKEAAFDARLKAAFPDRSKASQYTEEDVRTAIGFGNILLHGSEITEQTGLLLHREMVRRLAIVHLAKAYSHLESAMIWSSVFFMDLSGRTNITIRAWAMAVSADDEDVRKVLANWIHQGFVRLWTRDCEETTDIEMDPHKDPLEIQFQFDWCDLVHNRPKPEVIKKPTR